MSNIIGGVVNQQYNFVRLKKYDQIIERLQCSEEDEHSLLFDDGMVPQYDSPIFACKFALRKGYDQYLAIANEDGKLAIVDVSKKGVRYGIWAHNNAIFDIAWPYDRMKIATASGDHSVKLFDITNSEIREERLFFGHRRSVKTVCFRREDANVFATGSRDGNILLWDSRVQSCVMSVGQADRFIWDAHADHVSSARIATKSYSKKRSQLTGIKSVTSLVFRDDNSLISCAAGDGLLKMWDVRKTYQSKPVPKGLIIYHGEKAKTGFSNLLIDQDSTKLYANCLDNTIYCYNAVTFNNVPIMQYRGHQNNTFYVKSSLSMDGNYLISGSSDECAYIWKTNSSLPYAKLTGHQAEVTCVAWRQNQLPTIATCSDDMKHKIWRIGNENISENRQEWDRGQVKIIDTKCSPIKFKPKLKRLISEISSTPRSHKKFRVQCDFCSKGGTSSDTCENCDLVQSNSSMYNGVNQTPDNSCQRRLFSSSSQNIIDNNKGIMKDETESTSKFSSTTESIPNISKLSCVSADQDIINSPTMNLPNFVIDGVAPHVSYSPVKKPDVDWLTKMRKDHTFKKELFESYAQSNSSGYSKLESSPRSGMSRKKPNATSPQCSLLKFFKVTNNKCDHSACSTKSNNCRFNSSPQSPSQQ